MGKLCLRFYFLNLTHLLNVANRYGCHYLNICAMVSHDKNIRCSVVDGGAAGSHALHMLERERYAVLRFRLFLEEVPVPYPTEVHYH